MSIAHFPEKLTREALVESLPGNDTASSADMRDPAFTYVPASHAKALDPENTIVEGIRGAGKSHWWTVLNSERHRLYLASVFPEARIKNNLLISLGYGAQSQPNDYPGKDTIGDLAKKYLSRDIWRAVIGAGAAFPAPFPDVDSTWAQKTQWVAGNPEVYEKLLYQVDQKLLGSGKVRLILFDALDRLAGDWVSIRPLAKALFQLALDLRSCRALRVKLFVRSDMIDDKDIFAFPDSSKLLAGKVTLNWRGVDLYALLFQCLGNANQRGAAIREHFKSIDNMTWLQDAETRAWKLPPPLRTDESVQREIFHAITGPFMGGGHKRGYPYSWLPNHLLDGREQVSPRSFAAALSSAASADAPPDWNYPLHYRSIQSGVQKASSIRVDEIKEDYPWVDLLIPPLRDLSVPCEAEAILDIWSEKTTIERLRSAVTGSDMKLPPPHLDDGGKGILVDLENLGVVQRLRDGRIQMPDVYRIAFGLGRRGGVKPLK